MQATFPHMQGRGGSIINFGSRTGTAGEAGFGIYADTKEGIRGLVFLASDEARYVTGQTINAEGGMTMF